MTPLRRRMLDELQRRNYTTDTIRGYIHAVKEFAEYFGKSPEALGAEEVREFQLYMIRDKKLALGTVALRMGALRFLYKKREIANCRSRRNCLKRCASIGNPASVSRVFTCSRAVSRRLSPSVPSRTRWSGMPATKRRFAQGLPSGSGRTR